MKKITLILLQFLIVSSLYAQCTAPSFNVNLSAASDTSWTLSGTSRAGVCCGSSNCITFNITLNPNTDLINFKVSNPSPSGSAFYQVNCGTPVSIGTPYCVSGVSSPMTITYCKPGGDRPNFTIIAGSVGKASDDITIRNTGCTDTLFVKNINPSSVVWTSIYPGAPGTYNSYLSCTAGCTSTLVSAKTSPAPPAYIDFQVSGAPNTLSCGTTCKDTVRVYFVNDMGVTITPPSPVTCATSGAPVTMTANPTGGLAPYSYTWNTGSTSQSITTTTTGTYTVTVSDKTQCPSRTVTKALAVQPVATFTYTAMYCKNLPSNPLPTFTGTGQAGTFTASPAGAVFVNANTGEIDLAASAPNQYLVTNTVAATATCPGATATADLFVLPVPFMTSPSSAAICTGGTVNIPLMANFSSSYSWIASDNPNVSGESLTPQSSTSLINTLINNTSSNQVVTYTVTPTATIWGNCPGTSQTVTVTVRPKDDASFHYSSSTFCKTASNPTAIITGSTGGSFSGSAGLAVSAGSGNINLSGTAVGSYTVTYSVNNTCPNTSTFPITVTAGPSATFSYSSSNYCQNAANPSPIFPAGSSAGMFSSTPGLVFVSNLSGQINLAASTPGTYTVLNSIAPAGGCALTTASVTVTITKYNSATFSYTGTPYCQNSSNPFPAFTGGSIAGVFTAPAGLSINSSTGEINLAASTPGTYTVTNTIPANGGCTATSATASVTITALPVSTFTYTGSPYCQNSTNPLPAFSGGGIAGTFTASSVLLIVNSNTGLIDLAASTCDNYLVTNTIPAANGCPAVSTSVPVTITALPIATFNYTNSPYCLNAANPTPVLSTGGTNGIFTASSSGLNVEPNSGTIDLTVSAGGTYTVTNTVPAYNGCPAVIATGNVTITTPIPGNFNYTGSPYCKNGVNPLPTFPAGNVAGTFTSTPGLSINSSTGEINLSASTAGTYTITNSTPSSNNCPGGTYTASITITPLPVATFNYTGSPYCSNGTNPAPTFIGGGIAGTFSSTAGLTVNAATGVIDLASSTAGTYTVTNTIAAANGCPAVSQTASVTITPLPVATFNYTGSPYCSNGSNPAPTFIGGGIAGTFSSTPGLSINAATGEINLSASTAGTYTVTNTVTAANGCPAVSQTASVTITPLPVATFSYTGSPYCSNGTNPSPTFIGGGSAGTFSSTSGLTINSSTGVIDLSSSTAGTYTVTNTITAANGCPAVSQTASVTITPLPVATFSYTASPYCSNGSNPAPTFTGGGTAGTFSSTSGLSINAATGEINLSTSTAGTYTVTNTVAAANGCPAVSETSQITITPLPVADFNYSSAAYCQNESNTLPAFMNGGTAGIFSANAGLTINSTTGELDFVNSAIGTYTITNTIAAANGCEEVAEKYTVTINPVATADAGSDASICEGSSFTLAGNVGGGASSLTWSANGNGTFDDATLPAATYTPSSADIARGNVTFILTTNDPAGPCSSVTDTIVLTIEPAAIANASSDGIICEGSSYQLSGNIGGGASSLTWATTGSGTFDNASAANATYTPSSADISSGNVTLTMLTNDPAGACPAKTDEMLLTINPQPVIAPASATICSGNETRLSLAATLPSAFTWTALDNSNTSGESLTPHASSVLNDTIINNSTSAETVNYSVLATATATGCSSLVPETINIVVNPTPTITSAAATSICSGTSLNFSLSSSVPSTFSWVAADNNNTNGESVTMQNTSSLTDLISNSSSVPQTVNYVITPTAITGGCVGANPQTVAVTVNPEPLVTGTNSTTRCSGTEVGMALTSSIPATFTWAASDNINTTGESLTPQNSSNLSDTIINNAIAQETINYSVIATATSTGCTSLSPQTVTVRVDPTPTVTSSASTTICSGNTVGLALTSNMNCTFSWTASDNTSTNGENTSMQNSSAILDTIINNSTVPQTVLYTINSTSTSGGCSLLTPMNISVRVNPSPELTNTNASTICSGSMVNIPLSSTLPVTYTWIAADNNNTTGESLTAQTTPTLNNTLINSSVTSEVVTYTVTAIDTNTGCSVLQPQLITVNVNASATANAGTDATICAGNNNYSLSGAIGGSASSLTWSTSGTGAFDDATSASANYIPSANDKITGNVMLILSTNDPAGVCPQAIDSVKLNITPLDDASFSYGTSTFCQSGTDPIPTITGVSGGTFTSSSTQLKVNSSTGRIILAQSTPGTYTVTYTTHGACPSSSTVSVTITDAPSAVFNYTASSYCQNASTNPVPEFTTGSSGGIFSSTTGLVIDSISGEINLAASTPGLYTITNNILPSGGCAAAIATAAVTIIQADDATFGYSSQAFCQQNTIEIPSISGFVGGAFSSTPSGLSINSGTGEISLSASNAGLYGVTYVTLGSCPASSTVNVTIRQSPVADAGNDVAISCGADSLILNGSGSSSGANYQYLWTTSNGTILSGNTTVKPSVNAPGTYSILVTDNNGCSATDNVNVIPNTNYPIANFTTSPGTNGTTPFVVTTTNTSQNALTYNWDFGNGTTSSTAGNSTITYTTPGTYTITLVASNNGKCADTSSIAIVVNPQEFLFIPEGFSPNGDGSNDHFEITGIHNYPNNKFIIFNRWGNTVYEASPYNNEWDGKATRGGMKVGDDELPVSTYYYLLDLGDGSKPIKGFIYLNK